MYNLVPIILRLFCLLWYKWNKLFLYVAFLPTGSRGTNSPGASRGMTTCLLRTLSTFANCMALHEASLVGGSHLCHIHPLEAEEEGGKREMV